MQIDSAHYHGNNDRTQRLVEATTRKGAARLNLFRSFKFPPRATRAAVVEATKN